MLKFLWFPLGTSFLLPLSFHQNFITASLKSQSDFTPENYATTTDHGDLQEATNMRRNFFLNIYMTPRMFNNFNELLNFHGFKNAQMPFYHRLTAGADIRKSVFYDWNDTAEEIGSVLIRQATRFDLEPTYFQNLFKKWLWSARGWQECYNVFRGVSTRNNIFVEPSPHMNALALQKYWRQTGTIWQVPFKAMSVLRDTWSIVNFARVSPQIGNLKYLCHYYTNNYFDQETHAYVSEPPLLKIQITNKKNYIKNNLSQLQAKLETNMDFQVPVFPNQVEIDPACYDFKITSIPLKISIFFKKFPKFKDIYKTERFWIQATE